MSKTSKRKSSESGKQSDNRNPSSAKDASVVKRQSVFERLGTKATSSRASSERVLSVNTSIPEAFCRSWALNGTCSHDKSCKLAHSHTLISPSKRSSIKKDSEIVHVSGVDKNRLVSSVKHQSPDVGAWDNFDQTELEYEDEKVLEKRRAALQRELELQMKKEGSRKEVVKSRRSSSSSSLSSSSSVSSSSSTSSRSSVSVAKKTVDKKRHLTSSSPESEKKKKLAMKGSSHKDSPPRKMSSSSSRDQERSKGRSGASSPLRQLQSRKRSISPPRKSSPKTKGSNDPYKGITLEVTLKNDLALRGNSSRRKESPLRRGMSSDRRSRRSSSRSRRRSPPVARSAGSRRSRPRSPSRPTTSRARTPDRKKEDERKKDERRDRKGDTREKKVEHDNSRGREKAREMAREKERFEALERCRERQREREKDKDRLRDDRDRKDVKRSNRDISRSSTVSSDKRHERPYDRFDRSKGSDRDRTYDERERVRDRALERMMERKSVDRNRERSRDRYGDRGNYSDSRRILPPEEKNYSASPYRGGERGRFEPERERLSPRDERLNRGGYPDDRRDRGRSRGWPEGQQSSQSSRYDESSREREKPPRSSGGGEWQNDRGSDFQESGSARSRDWESSRIRDEGGDEWAGYDRGPAGDWHNRQHSHHHHIDDRRDRRHGSGSKEKDAHPPIDAAKNPETLETSGKRSGIVEEIDEPVKRPRLSEPPALEELSDISDDDDILNRVDPEFTEGEDSRMGESSQAAVCDTASGQGERTEIHMEDNMQAGSPKLGEDENMVGLDFEEISDEELEEESKINKGGSVGDALGVDWASLMAECRPKKKPEESDENGVSSVRARWEASGIFNRISVSSSLASPEYLKKLKEKFPHAVPDVGEVEAGTRKLMGVAALQRKMAERKAKRANVISISMENKQALSARADIAIRPSPPGKPFLVPGSPYDDPDVITIGWDSPVDIGGGRLCGYIVEHKRTGSPYWVKATPLLVKHSQLSLSGLEPGMRYQFRVTAENNFGRSEPSPLSEPFVISFSRGGVAVAPMFSTGLTDTTAIENEKVEFFVKVEGTPTPKISWFKDGFEVFSNRRQKVSTDGDISSLVIHQTALSDEGEIKCTATNKAGHAVTKAKLTLEAPPSIRLQRQYEDGLLFELGEVVRFKVAVSGRPQPEVTWYHNGEELKPDGRIEMAVTDKHALVKIADATRLDRGEYQVKAKNSIGDDSASFLVTITDRPLPPENVEVVMTLGRCVTLGWSKPKDDGGCMIGNYIVEYYRIGWDMWLKAATCRQLQTTIGDLIEGSEYKFRVKAENPYGASEPSKESDVVFIPDPKRGLLEPPPKGSPVIVEETPEEWLQKRRSHNEQRSKRSKSPGKDTRAGEWTEDESLPSQVVLAHQVLKKVKLAPQRTWSEDSQGSPPRESPEKRPVPPKRKHRPSTIHETSVSPPPTPVKKEKKLPPHLQKEFERVYAQMGDREPSPETIAASRRIRALGKLDPTEDPPAERSSRKLDVVRPSSRKPSKSPRRLERESRTPSTVREVTPRVSISPEPYRPKTPKSLEIEEEERRFEEERRKKEEELRKKEEELLMKMEELRKKEEALRREEERRQREEDERRRRAEKEEERKNRETSKKVEWGRELSHDIHSSSEMMLVLLPNNEEQDEGERVTAEELKEGGFVAPPMSLSAPVLGGCEMPPPSLRAAVSSSEIMYELAMARLSKEADEEEAEANLQQKYGLDRKRSFERKTHKKSEVGQYQENTVSMENLSRIEQDLSKLEQKTALTKQMANEVEPPPSPPPRRQSDLPKKGPPKTDNFTERFMALEKSFENYNQKFEFDDRLPSDVGSDMERSFDYYDDVAEDEDTYHPRMATGVFTPMAVQLPSREFAERVPSPQSLVPPPLITISEDEEKEPAKVPSPAKIPEKVPEMQFPPQVIQKVIVRETISPDRVPEPPPIVKQLDTIEPPQVIKRRSPSPKSQLAPVEPKRSPSPTQLKPILKTRDRSTDRSDRSDVSDTEGAPKRVRIEEPNQKQNIDLYAKEENDMGLQAGEVARNRRKAKPQQTSGDEPIVVNIYSDIIREYNRQIKGPKPKKLYLNYDELKQAAEKSSGNTPVPTLDEIEASAKAEREQLARRNPAKPADASQNTAEKAADSQESTSQSEAISLPKPRKLYMEYLLDLFLFLVAVWLYVFKDPRLTIPVLMLMVYRQLHETVHSKISAIGKWFRPKEE